MRQHSHQMISVYDLPQQPHHFDMSHIRHSISAISSDQPDPPPPPPPKTPSSSRPSLSSTTNGSNNSSKEISDSALKKERIKTLWGKVRKQGLLQAAAAKQHSGQSTSKWDQVLAPLLKDQKGLEPVSVNYFKTTVGGEAGGGSGFFGQPGNATMECDCGDDSCPQCNLMLNMGSTY